MIGPVNDALGGALPDATLALGSSPRNTWQVSPTVCNLVRAGVAARPSALPALAQSLVLDLARTALIVIDMQNDFCHPQGWLASIGVDVSPARQLIAPLQALLPRLRTALVPALWVNWGNRPDRLNLSPSTSASTNTAWAALPTPALIRCCATWASTPCCLPV